MRRDRHYTANELADLRKQAVLACADYYSAVHWNQYLTDYGIEPVVPESWSTVLSKKVRGVFRPLPVFSVGAE